MNLATYARRNLFRRRGRTIMTLLAIAIVVVVFCLLRTVVVAWNAGAEEAAKDRMDRWFGFGPAHAPAAGSVEGWSREGPRPPRPPVRRPPRAPPPPPRPARFGRSSAAASGGPPG